MKSLHRFRHHARLKSLRPSHGSSATLRGWCCIICCSTRRDLTPPMTMIALRLILARELWARTETAVAAAS